jgi:predicted TIM-barrel fold metal-dependent hydrolase
VRGVRDPGKTRVLLEPRYRAHVRRLAREDLLFEIFCSQSRYADLAELARACPDTQIVLEHFGLAPSPRDERFAGWRERLRALAELPNVRLKLSGLGMVDRHWRFDDAAVLVAEGLEAFGVERCVLGSNWPIDRAASSYPDAIGALAAATADLSPPERRALFSANAEELYRL